MSVGKAGAQLPKILPQPGHLEQGGIRVPPAAPVELAMQVGGFFCQIGLGAGGDQGPPPAAQHLRLQGLDEALQEVRESLGGSGPPQPSFKMCPTLGRRVVFPHLHPAVQLGAAQPPVSLVRAAVGFLLLLLDGVKVAQHRAQRGLQEEGSRDPSP